MSKIKGFLKKVEDLIKKISGSIKKFYVKVFRTDRKQSFKSYKFKQKIIPYLFLTPNLIIFSIFIILPAFIGIYYSFTDVDLFHMKDYDFILFQNYTKLFGDEDFLGALTRTLLLVGIVFPLLFVFSLVLALIIVKPLKAKGLFRASYYWPVMISAIVVGIIWNWILGGEFGMFNTIWKSFGFEASRTLTNRGFAWFAVVLAIVWSRAGYYMIIFMAALLSIPVSLYEAAEVDGASTWQRFWGVTYPSLRPARLMVTILLIMEIFKTYAIVVTLTSGGPLDGTTFTVQYIYETAFKHYDIGYASAMSVIMLLFVTLISAGNFFLNKGGTD